METDGHIEPESATPTGLEEVPTRDLVDELVDDLKELGRIELRRVGKDAKKSGKKVVAALLLGGMGAGLALVGLLVLAFTVVYLLAFVMPLWVSGLIIGGAALTVGGLVAFGALAEARKSVELATAALETVEEEAEWARETVHEAKEKRAAT